MDVTIYNFLKVMLVIKGLFTPILHKKRDKGHNAIRTTFNFECTWKVIAETRRAH